ncbi:hypothetical protein B0H21DRAFT_858564 [Amylocystis lapponica]|nr:hypothetical protein B0H21DRAFT_858564 [Amylocystis lapponica]
MEKALCHVNGTMLLSAEYNNIRTTARQIRARLLNLPPPKDKTFRHPPPKTKTYYWTHHRGKWNEAVRDLKRNHSLLMLRSHHWKAEHVLGAVLLSGQSTVKASKYRLGKGTGVDDDSDDQVDELFDELDTISPATDGSSAIILMPPPTATISVASKRPRIQSKSASDRTASKKLKTTTANNGEEKGHEIDSNNAGSLVGQLGSAKAAALLQLPSITFLEPSATMKTPPLDVSFIQVDLSLDNISAVILQEFPGMQCGIELLDAMKIDPDFGAAHSPSPNTLIFIEHIERADPNAPGLDEDDTGVSWGHSQFTAGSMTCSTVLTSWASIGNSATARRLITASIKTCRVAWHICYVKNINTEVYLSDAYLENVLELLWKLWRESGGPTPKGKNVARAPSPQPSASGRQLSPPPPSLTNENEHVKNAGPLVTQSANHTAVLQTYIGSLTKDELLDWIKEQNLTLGKPRPKKDELVAIIASADAVHQPSKEDFDAIIRLRKTAKKSSQKNGKV